MSATGTCISSCCCANHYSGEQVVPLHPAPTRSLSGRNNPALWIRRDFEQQFDTSGRTADAS